MKNINIKSASISQRISKFDNNIWRDIRKILRIILLGSDIRITICKDNTITPTRDQIANIIEEIHETPFAGHKGVTKTFSRMRENYFCE